MTDETPENADKLREAINNEAREEKAAMQEAARKAAEALRRAQR